MLPARDDAERRVEAAAFWADWSARLGTKAPGVRRSSAARSRSNCSFALLRLHRRGPDDVAAGADRGTRNWDYGFGWLRDGVYTSARCSRSAAWRGACVLLVADALGRPRAGLRPLRRRRPPHRRGGADGARYRNSAAPVRVGNAAAVQLQLDTYGSLLEGAWRFWSKTGSSSGSAAGDRGARGLRRGELAAP